MGLPSEKVAGLSQSMGARPSRSRGSPCSSECGVEEDCGVVGTDGGGGEGGAAPPGSVGRACRRWTVARGAPSAGSGTVSDTVPTGSGAGDAMAPDGDGGEATEVAEAAAPGDAVVPGTGPAGEAADGAGPTGLGVSTGGEA